MREQPKLLLVTGLQKSGTTLLLRLLVNHTAAVSNPFTLVEGHDFWGNVPSHAPREFPAGTIYLRNDGRMGHEISPNDADDEVCRVLHERLACLQSSTPVIVNKSPYHTVRLPWIKAVFPHSFVVCTFRHAVPNVFSLLKKHLRPDECDRPWREGRWYGVKPRNWRAMLDEDRLVQCSRQWDAVLRKVWSDRHCVDLFVSYQELCNNPSRVLHQILRGVSPKHAECDTDAPLLRCRDDEYRVGAALRSLNEVSQLDCTPTPTLIELPAFSNNHVASIQSRCAEIEGRFEQFVANS